MPGAGPGGNPVAAVSEAASGKTIGESGGVPRMNGSGKSPARNRKAISLRAIRQSSRGVGTAASGASPGTAEAGDAIRSTCGRASAASSPESGNGVRETVSAYAVFAL